jgi:hypothetical protein
MEASRGRPRALALGIWLATRGALSRASLVMAALGALASIAAAIAMRGSPAVREIPAVAAMALAWGAGVTLAFGVALRALRLDREQGLVLLARSRGVGAAAYTRGRVGGLVWLLALAVGGGTLVAGFAATAVAGNATASVARASVAALVYALAFSVTLGPLTMAALGARTRPGGYLALLAVLGLPEALAPWTRQLLPAGWHELTSIPAALEALRAGVESSGAAGLHALRAAVALVAVIAASLLFVRARVARDSLHAGGAA